MSVVLIRRRIASFGTRPESEHSPKMSQESSFGSKERTWAPKITYVCAGVREEALGEVGMEVGRDGQRAFH